MLNQLQTIKAETITVFSCIELCSKLSIDYLMGRYWNWRIEISKCTDVNTSRNLLMYTIFYVPIKTKCKKLDKTELFSWPTISFLSEIIYSFKDHITFLTVTFLRFQSTERLWMSFSLNVQSFWVHMLLLESFC